MRIRDAGPIDPHLTMLGTPKSCLYLVQGEEHALVGGGGQWVVPELERQFDQWRVDTDRIRYLVLGHAHFDHCGAVPYLLHRYPHLQVVGSPGAAEFLAIPKAVRNAQRFSREATLRMGCPMEHGGVSLEWDSFPLARVVRDGDVLDLGAGVELRFFEAPGHSRCSMITYLGVNQCLFPSDSLHAPAEQGSGFLCTASESFRDYQESLRKVAHLTTNLCAWEHHGVHTGEDAREAVARGLQLTREYQEEIRVAIAAGEDADALAQRLSTRWLGDSGFRFVTAEILLHIYRVMIANALAEPLQ
ncbi:MAG: MBL fold metallo-hydrolase [Proteobacteria bacterium]|nr:MBL fold metallo-hydrolase [Pseudomonadota bacterium]